MGSIHEINIEGLDIGEAIRIIEDEEILEAMMRTYLEDGQQKLKSIEEALHKDNLADYAVYVHALKSSSKAIGALTLSDKFRELELAGKGNDAAFVKSKNGAVIDEYKALLDALRGHFGKAQETLKFTQSDAEPLLKALRTKDMGECLSMLDILSEKGYSSYVEGNLEDIRTAVEIQDFEDAEAILEDVLLTIEVSGL